MGGTRHRQLLARYAFRCRIWVGHLAAFGHWLNCLSNLLSSFETRLYGAQGACVLLQGLSLELSLCQSGLVKLDYNTQCHCTLASLARHGVYQAVLATE